MKLPTRTGGPARELTLELPATHGAVRQARSVARSFARLDGVHSDEVDRLALVLTELLGNAVDHGGGQAAMDAEDLDGDVRMRLWLELRQDQWTLEVTDEGEPEAPGAEERVAVPDLEQFLSSDGDHSEDDIARAIEAKLAEAEGDQVPDLDHDRGRGFFLIREMVDELEVVERDDGPGRTVRVLRRYASGA